MIFLALVPNPHLQISMELWYNWSNQIFQNRRQPKRLDLSEER